MDSLNYKQLKNLTQEKLIDIIIKQNEIIINLQKEIQALKKDSSNSSKPPSTDRDNTPKRKFFSRKKSGKKKGGQKGHQGKTREQLDNPDKIVFCKPDKCHNCGHDLTSLEGNIVSKRQEADIPPIKIEVIEYQRQSIACPCCQQKNLGVYPNHLTAPMQLGLNVKSFIAYLNIKHKIPFKRLTKIFSDMLNVRISEGTIDKTLEQFSNKSKEIYNQLLKMVKNEQWIGSDETGTKVNGKKWWLWVWQNVQVSYYAISNSRGYKVVEEFFGSNYWGILVHDCWSAQNNTVAKLGHQLCHAHLLRDLEYFIENYRDIWCYKMKQLLLSSQKAKDKIWYEYFDTDIRNRVIADYNQQLESLITQELSVQKEIRTLQKRFIKHQEKILYFMDFRDVPFHNNSSERAIRNAKIHKKISGGFRSEHGAQRHTILLSIIETCKKQNLNVLDSLKQIYSGTFSFNAGE